jgi:hypothetical protein
MRSMGWTLDSAERLTICAVILLLALATLRACPAGAQEIPSDPPPVPLNAGDPAPFDGDLWSPVRSLRVTLRAEACEERRVLELGHAARGFEIDLKYERQSATNRAKADAERIELLRGALADATAWYSSPTFVAAVSSVATLALVVVSAVVLEAVLGGLAGLVAP